MPADSPSERGADCRAAPSFGGAFYAGGMQLDFRAPVWEWRGPAPFHFVTVPEAESGMLAAASEMVTYGWGMIPVAARIGGTDFTTSLWPKDGGYVVPLKDAVRRAEGIQIGDEIAITLTVDV